MINDLLWINYNGKYHADAGRLTYAAAADTQ
jgi:hypothetical protein